MDFIAAIVITLLIWAGIGYLSWILVRTFRRLRNSGRWVVWLKRAILIAVCGTIIVIATGNTPLLLAIGSYLWISFSLPFFLLLFVQICFWVYNKLKHGAFFYEEHDRTHVRVVYRGEEAKKRGKKYCPVCKRNTRCKVSPRNAPIPFHILRD